jgi:HEPN domain-containing protein
MTADLQKDIKYWLDIADYDIKTAVAMLKTGRYLYVLVTCQQAVEKILKALVTIKTKEFPPRTHNLLKLVGIVGLNLTEEDKLFLEKLGYYYLETRYPETVAKISKEINHKIAKEYFEKSNKIIKCLKQKIK